MAGVLLSCCRRKRRGVTDNSARVITVTSSRIVYGIDRSTGEYTDISSVIERRPTVPDAPQDDEYQQEHVTMVSIGPRKLWEFDPKHLAEHLTSCDVMMLRAIRISELQSGKWTKKDKETLSPNVISMIESFNRLAYIVCTEIVTAKNPMKRALIITYYIKLMGHLHKLRNYNSMTAIKAALTNTAIYRLSETWRLVAKRKRKKFDKFSNTLCLISNADKLLTDMVQLCDRSIPCIPYLGWLLHSINQWQTYEKFLKKSLSLEEEKTTSSDEEEVVDEQLTNIVKPSAEDILVAITVASEEASGVPVDDKYHSHTVGNNVSILALFKGFQRNTLLYGRKLTRRHSRIAISLEHSSCMDTEQLMRESIECENK